MTVRLWDPETADRAQVYMEFAGAADDVVSLELARSETHDSLLRVLAAKGLRQAGPIEWRAYLAVDAEALVREAGLEPENAAGLFEYLAQPGTVLVIASVAYLP